MLNLFLFTLFIILIIVFSILRNKVLREIGFRNILRKRATTILIIFGSLIGTALISGSLTLGDSFNKSTRQQAENTLGEIDATLTKSNSSNNDQDTTRGLNIPDPKNNIFNQLDINNISNSFDETKVDGTLPALVFNASIVKGENPEKDLSVSNIDLVAFQKGKLGNEIVDINVQDGKTIVSEQLAQRLDLKLKDRITVYSLNTKFDLEVQGINYTKGASNFTNGNGNLIVSPSYLQKELKIKNDGYNVLFVSSKGGFYETTYDSQKFTDYLNSKTSSISPVNGKWIISEKKSSEITGGNDFIVYAFLGVSIVGVLAGILLIINIYSMLAEERKSEMGTLRAIALTRSKLIKMFVYEGLVYSIISSILGVIIGIGVGYILLDLIQSLTQSIIENNGFKIIFDTTVSSWIASFCIGLLITLGTSYIASRRISKINIVSAIRNIPDEKDIKRTKWSVIKVIIQFFLLVDSIGSIIAGIIILNSSSKSQFSALISPEDLGGYLIFLGVVLTAFLLSILLGKLLTSFGKEEYKRILVTIFNLPPLFLSLFLGKIDIFSKVFQSLLGYSLLLFAGLTIVITLTTIITYNIDILLWILGKIFNRFPKFNGIFKLALRYSAENKFRTGLTVLMFSIVLFLVAFLSVFKQTIDQQFEKFTPKDGYQAFVTAPQNLNASEIKQKVESLNITSNINIQKSISVDYAEITKNDLGTGSKLNKDNNASALIFGFDQTFLNNNSLKLVSHLNTFKNDQETIQAILNDGHYILLGPVAFGTNNYLNPPEKLKLGKTLLIKENGKQVSLIIAGYLDQTSPENYSIFQYPLIGSTKVFTDVLDKTYVDQYYQNNIFFRYTNTNHTLNESLQLTQKKLIAFNLASQLFSIGQLFQTASSFIKGAISILQGFLSFALLVGIAGVAIIMIRSVKERRQQIGMLRSLGFQRSSILMSFFIEASFIIFLGIAIGIFSGTITGNLFFDVRNNAISSAGGGTGAIEIPSTPYNELILIAFLVYVVSIVFTLLPSYQASRLSPVEATNYLD